MSGGIGMPIVIAAVLMLMNYNVIKMTVTFNLASLCTIVFYLYAVLEAINGVIEYYSLTSGESYLY